MLSRLGMYNGLRDFLNSYRMDNSSRKAFLAQFVQPGSLCFDIGANIGEKTDLLRSLGCKVVACEPQKECADYLRKKYRNDPQVIVVEKAIASFEGTSEFFLCGVNQLSTLSGNWVKALKEGGRFGELEWGRKITVPTTTLFNLTKEFGNPVFLKADVEGFEYEVLKTLTMKISCVCFEFALPENWESLENSLKHLDGLGDAKYNFSCNNKSFVLDSWGKSQPLIDFLKENFKKYTCGDIFVKYAD
ncbi:MAG: FkbM family methyltransferase [Candidatus Omnitrophica bacterium]|nr:FkbM family methyltransferase [Candidatus Omnitrophota bacterium]